MFVCRFAAVVVFAAVRWAVAMAVVVPKFFCQLAARRFNKLLLHIFVCFSFEDRSARTIYALNHSLTQ